MARKVDYNYRKQADIKADGWEGEEALVHSTPLVEDGSGPTVLVRKFDFAIPPNVQLPAKEKLLEFHRSKVLAFLWADELEPIKDLRIQIAKNKRGFRIFATCQAKKGSRIYEQPQLLQEITNDTKGHS